MGVTFFFLVFFWGRESKRVLSEVGFFLVQGSVLGL